jgi:hypothetical protein
LDATFLGIKRATSMSPIWKAQTCYEAVQRAGRYNEEKLYRTITCRHVLKTRSRLRFRFVFSLYLCENSTRSGACRHTSRSNCSDIEGDGYKRLLNLDTVKYQLQHVQAVWWIILLYSLLTPELTHI